MEGADGNATREYLRSLSTADFNALQSLSQPYEITLVNTWTGLRILRVDARTYRDVAHRDRVRRVLLDRGREQGREKYVQGLLEMADEVAGERTARLLCEESDHGGRVDCNCRTGYCTQEGEVGFDGGDCGDVDR